MRPRIFSFAGAFCFFVSHSDLAMAEVCDKIAPEWNSDSGRVTILEEMQPALTAQGLLLLTILALFVVAPRKFKFSRIDVLLKASGGISLLIATIAIFGELLRVFDKSTAQIYAMGFNEGCLTGYNTSLFVWAVAATLQLFASFYARRRYLKSLSR